LMLSRANDGRRRARECFQIAPSLEKIELPSRGMKVARRACVDVSWDLAWREECVRSGFFLWTYRSYFEFLRGKSAAVFCWTNCHFVGLASGTASFRLRIRCCRKTYRELCCEDCLHVCRFAGKYHGPPVHDLIKGVRIITTRFQRVAKKGQRKEHSTKNSQSS
jgi:hypothetical protein